MPRIDLSEPDNGDLDRGATLLKEALWFFVGLPMLRSSLISSSSFRCWLLRLFGSNIGKGVYIKPSVRVKFPWYLDIGDHSWIGEDAWIDNISRVIIGPHACISQGAYLCTGNHDWSSTNMKLFHRPIVCGPGSWVGAKALVCPGVMIGEGAVLTAGSVAARSIAPFEIHGGNPATFLRKRLIDGAKTSTRSDRKSAVRA